MTSTYIAKFAGSYGLKGDTIPEFIEDAISTAEDMTGGDYSDRDWGAQLACVARALAEHIEDEALAEEYADAADDARSWFDLDAIDIASVIVDGELGRYLHSEMAAAA